MARWCAPKHGAASACGGKEEKMQKTPEKVERQILALLKAGMTQKAVREKFGVGYAVIRRIVEENGLLRADRELERHKKLDFPQYLLDDWDETRIELLERARRWQ